MEYVKLSYHVSIKNAQHKILYMYTDNYMESYTVEHV